MTSAVSAEELAELAGVSASTVHKIANELFEVLRKDLENHRVVGDGTGSS